MTTQLDTLIHMLLRAQWQASNEMLNGLYHEARKAGDKEAMRTILDWKRVNNQCRAELDRNIPADAVSAFPPYLPVPRDMKAGRHGRKRTA